MKLSDKIQSLVMGWVIGSPSDIVIPNFYVGRYEMDVCKIVANSKYIVEFEIKISRSDFFADFKKKHIEIDRSDMLYKSYNKHDLLANRTYVANRFFYVVPDGLITVAECPPYAGLMYYKDGQLRTVKPAKLLHKTPFADFESVANTLSARERRWRNDYKWAKSNYDNLEKEYFQLLNKTKQL